MTSLLEIPLIQREGIAAANLGVCQSSKETPMGFTFCPYAHGSVERWNFLGGCVVAYMEQDRPVLGEQ